MIKTLISMALGAGSMYLLDRERGSERRWQVMGKLSGTLRKTSEAVHAKADKVEVVAKDLTAKVDEKAAEVIANVGPQVDGGASDAPQEGSGQEGDNKEA